MISRVLFSVVLLVLTSVVQADWVDTGGDVYTCTSGTCTMTCDAEDPCNNFTFIATQAATEANVFCSANSACSSITLFLAAQNSQSLICSDTDACDGATIYVGVPGSGSNGLDVAVPASFEQSDFFGDINSFSLTCSAASGCDNVALDSFYDIATVSVGCADETDSCKNMDINAASIDGNISLSCLGADACDTVSFTTRTDGNALCADDDNDDEFDHCSSVTSSASAAPSPDVDQDGVVDLNDLCPTGLSSHANGDADSNGCDDVLELLLDDDGDGVPNVLDGRELVWDGVLIDGDFFDEDNWLDDEQATEADVINPDQVIGREIFIGSTFAVGMSLADNISVLLGYDNSMTLKTTRMFASANTAFRPTSTVGGNATITLQSSSLFEFGWMWDISLVLEGNSVAVALGDDESSDTGVLGKGTTVNFKGTGSGMTFENVSQSEVQALISKFLVDGEAAVLNSTLIVQAFNGTGAKVYPDFDADGFYGGTDACPKGDTVTTDWDNDGCEDTTEDLDDDNDGEPDSTDLCPESTGADFDGDGCDANQDDDDDNDGMPDSQDQCLTPNGLLIVDKDNDGCDDDTEDNDDDNDGVKDSKDACFTKDGDLSADFDGDGCDDADEDKDDDNDGFADSVDQFPLDPLRSKKSGGGGGGSMLWFMNALLFAFALRRKNIV